MWTRHWHEEVHLGTWWLVPNGKRAYPMLPVSYTPHATNRVKKQVILELLSTVQLVPTLRPLAAESTTRGYLQIPTYHSSESHLHILRPERSMRITCKGSGYPFLSFWGNVSNITLKPMPLRQTAFPGCPASLTFPPPPTDSVLPHRGSITSRIWSVLYHSVTSQVTPSRRQQITEVPTQRMQKYRLFLAVSKHLRPELLGHGTLSSYSSRGQPPAKPPVLHWARSIPGWKSGNRRREQTRVTAVAKCWECSFSPTPSLYWSL